MTGHRDDREGGTPPRRSSARPSESRSSFPPPPASSKRWPVAAPADDEEVRTRLERLASLGARAAEVAHELRNALSVLETSLHLAKRSIRGDGQAEARLLPHFTRMAEQVHAGQAIVREALDQARLGGPERAPIDLRTFLLETVSAIARPEAIVVEVEAPAGLVSIDARQMRQLLLNLLRNALEAIGAGRSGVVRVVATLEGARLSVEVRDDGPGIDPAIAKRLFQPFATGKRKGTGLGLAVCRRIAEAHGGTLEARPIEPHGTAMVVEIPLVS